MTPSSGLSGFAAFSGGDDGNLVGSMFGGAADYVAQQIDAAKRMATASPATISADASAVGDAITAQSRASISLVEAGSAESMLLRYEASFAAERAAAEQSRLEAEASAGAASGEPERAAKDKAQGEVVDAVRGLPEGIAKALVALSPQAAPTLSLATIRV